MDDKTFCEKYGHDYRASRTVSEDAFGVRKRRQFYCTFCGQDRPRRRSGEDARTDSTTRVGRAMVEATRNER